MALRESIDTALIQFRFGENELLDPIPPDNILSFTYEDTIATSSDKITCELYDPEWTRIENLIIEYKGILDFRFGWSSGEKSAWRKMSIVKHNPTFDLHGIHLSLEGYDTSVIANDEAKCKGWEEEKYKGNIAEIIRKIADENEWEYDSESIVDTKEVLNEEGYPRIFVQRQIPDLTFIKEILLPFAETPEGTGGFRCYYKSAENKFYFRPPKLNNKAYKQYTIFKDRFGEVISFSPDLGDGSLQRQIGALNTRLVGLDPYKRKLYDVVVNNKETTDNKVVLGKYMPEQEIKTVGGTGRYSHTAATTEEAASSKAKQQWFERFNQFFTADMEVIGDPNLEPGSIIGVIVLTTENEPFYCSGNYEIKVVEHVLEGGNYISRLKLEKNALREGDLDVARLGLGTVNDDIELLIEYFSVFI